MSYKSYHKNNPWAQKLFSARARCRIKNPSYNCYKTKSIKCFLTMQDIKKLWFKYEAFRMARPSLDRIDSTKNYEFSNCRFIEYRENALQGSRMAGISCSKPIDKYDLNGNYIKSYLSIGEAARELGNYDYKYSIASCCRKSIIRGKRKLTAYGFIWRFKGMSPDW